MKKATISDVAKYANVSKSTVSQYLNGRYNYMSESTKKRIEKTIKELQYQTNYLARSLKQKRTFTIGVIVSNILHRFSTQVTRAIEDVCNEQNTHVIICNADDNPEKEKEYINVLRAKQVDGIITFPTGGNVELYQQMLDEQFPFVFIDRKIENINIDSFLLDNKGAMKMGIDHLIDKGHYLIGMITTSLHNITPRVERIEGYKRALKYHGIPINKEYVKTLDLQNIKNGLEEMLSLKKPPTALFAGNDLTLMEVLNFTKENKIKIPDDLAIISIDDVSFANIYTPSLTTIAQPGFNIGMDASKLLLKRINYKENPDQSTHRFKGELIVRDSC